MTRCVVGILVVADAFALGFATGDEGEQNHKGFEGYRGEYLMMEGRNQWGGEESQEGGYNSGMTQCMQYMMGRSMQVVTQFLPQPQRLHQRWILRSKQK